VSAKDVHAALGRYLVDRERSQPLRQAAIDERVTFVAVGGMLHHLADHCGRGQWSCWLLFSTLQAETEVSKRVLSRMIAAARKAGVIEVTRQGPHASGYRFALDQKPVTGDRSPEKRHATSGGSTEKRHAISRPKTRHIPTKDTPPVADRTNKRTKAPRATSVSANAHRSAIAIERGERSGAPEPTSIAQDGIAPSRPQPAQGGPGRCSDDGADPPPSIREAVPAEEMAEQMAELRRLLSEGQST
jgi:hypothetical protein